MDTGEKPRSKQPDAVHPCSMPHAILRWDDEMTSSPTEAVAGAHVLRAWLTGMGRERRCVVGGAQVVAFWSAS